MGTHCNISKDKGFYRLLNIEEASKGSAHCHYHHFVYNFILIFLFPVCPAIGVHIYCVLIT